MTTAIPPAGSPIPVHPADSPESWVGWTEYSLMLDLGLDACPTCMRHIPDGFLMFRPAGLEYWRCLGCLARTRHGGVLHLTRTGDGGLATLTSEIDSDEEAPF